MQKPLLTLTLAMLATYTLAQKNTPGYLITLQNYTVQGTLGVATFD